MNTLSNLYYSVKSRIQSIDPAQIGKIAYAGAALGLLEGVVAQSLFPSQISRSSCKSFFSNYPLINGVSLFKQMEIKTFAPLTAMLPLAAKVGYDAYHSKERGLLNKIKAACFQNVNQEQIRQLFKIGLGIASYSCASYLGLTKTFDPSGHALIKVLCAGFLSKSLSHIVPKNFCTAKVAALAYSSLYALTDLFFLYQTAKACHTPLETLAGIAWGLSIQSLTR